MLHYQFFNAKRTIYYDLYKNINYPHIQMKNLKEIIPIIIFSLLFYSSNSYLQKTVTLSPLHSLIYTLDFSDFINDNISCMITVTATVSGTTQTIFDKTCTQLFDGTTNYEKQIKVWNFELSSSTIHVLFSDLNSTETVDYYEQQLIKKEQTVAISQFVNVVLMKADTSNYLLPFNLLSEKTLKTFVQEDREVMSVNTYESQPFLDTYWNQLGADQVTMPWLPYFSNCQGSTSRIFLHEILQPSNCEFVYNFYGNQYIICPQKSLSINCISEENYLQSSKYTWWQNQESNPFYFFKSSLSLSTLQGYYSQNANLEKVVAEYYENLVPLIYSINYDITSENPNIFTFQFYIDYNVDSYSICSVKLTSSYDSKQTNSQLEIKVHYMSTFQKYRMFCHQAYIYPPIFLIFTTLLLFFMKKILSLCKVNCHYYQNFKKVIFPVIKGSFYAMFNALLFFISFYKISSQTKFSAINTNFNSTTAVEEEYYGRIGLTMFISGLFILNSGINQTFKVRTPQETKILLEDDQLERKQSCEKELNQEDKQNFIIKNMNSHRKYLFLYVFFCSLLILFLYYQLISLKFQYTCLIIVFVYPLIQKLLLTLYRHFIVKQLLYLSAIRVAFEAFFDLFIMKGRTVYECFLLYFLKLITDCYIIVGLELGVEKLAYYLYEKRKQNSENCCLFWIFYHFKEPIKIISKESKYEKGLFYGTILTTKTASSIIRFYIFPLVIWTMQHTEIARDFAHSKSQIIIIVQMLLIFASIDQLVVQINIKIFDSYFKIPITKILQFSHFKFSRRKVRFLSDNFNQNRCIDEFYRQFQKFSFSSQVYIITFLISFSILSLTLGLKTIIEFGYVAYYDPVLLVIFAVVWISGHLLSFLQSFIVIKFRFYETKEDGKMRAKLDTIQKIMKKNDYSEYLDIQGVKNYFLYHCRTWIIENLSLILTRQDFEENGGRLLSTYKYYKSLLKKRQIEQRKRKEMIHKKTAVYEKKDNCDKEIIIKVPTQPFEEFTKPLLYSWLYIAKQFSYLKKLIAHIKEEEIQDVCEFCSMNIELQAIEKHEFANIVDEYRVLNVGRVFYPEHFIQFYRFRQEHITVCIECKDKRLYLMKKNISIHGTPMILLKKWLMKARSRLLHQHQKEGKKKI